MEREKSWLAAELPYQLVVPLILTNIDIGEGGLQVDERARIEGLTDDDLRRMEQGYDLAGVPFPLATAARFAVVVDMPPMENPGEGIRWFLRDPPPDMSAVEATCDALRIVANGRTGWARVFRRPVGWADIWEDALPNLSEGGL
jgi:hypothetical protein